MRLLDYIKRFCADGRAAFALKVGTTVGHLNNVAYGQRVPSAALAKQIAVVTDGQVPEWDLRPSDWHRIWPELVGAEGAPAPEAANAA